MLFPERFLEDLRDRCPIEEVAAQYVELKRSGANLSGLCPFHREKTPSFVVSPDKQIFHCFGCGTGGNVINFIMKIENLEFPDAVALLSNRAGLELPDSGADRSAVQRRSRTIELNRLAARYFHEQLTAPEGKGAHDYLVSRRRLSPAVIRRFGLGFAPPGFDRLTNYLKANGAQYDELIYSGLSVKTNSGALRDRFRNRVMFPIIDVKKAVVGFGGRVMDDSMPKYLNSPDTPAFNKSRNLYALNHAKNDNGGRLILAEGYMDVIALHAAGFTNAVASLGTALTHEQARLMARYANEVIIAYDADGAGKNAASRAIDVLKEANLSVRVLKITGGKDPDDFIKEQGADRFRLLLEGSENYIEYRLMELARPYDMEDIRQKAAFLGKAAEVLSAIDNAVERELYIGRLAGDYSISVEALSFEIKKLLAKKKKNMAARYKKDELMRMRPHTAVRAEAGGKNRSARAEQMLLSLICDDTELLKPLEERICPADFALSLNGRLYEFIKERFEAGLPFDITAMEGRFDGQEIAYLTGILCAGGECPDRFKTALDLVDTIKLENSRAKALLSPDGNTDEMREMIEWYEQMKSRKKTQ